MKAESAPPRWVSRSILGQVQIGGEPFLIARANSANVWVLFTLIAVCSTCGGFIPVAHFFIDSQPMKEQTPAKEKNA